MRKLNLGCGACTPDNWTNVDYALGAKIAKFPFFNTLNKKIKIFDITWNDQVYIHDLTKRFPWEDLSIDIIYTSHTLEHFTRQDGFVFLHECFRVLKLGGIFRVVVPDLSLVIRDYHENKIRADEFIENLGVLFMPNSNKIKDKMAPFFQFPHKCMYDTPTLLSILKTLGFDVERRKPFDSSIDNIEEVELEKRTKKAVIIEGIKNKTLG